MTLEQLIALLTNKFPGARKDGLAQLAKSLIITVTTEEDAQALVEKITDEQVTEFVNNWRKEVDAEVTKGVNTFKKKHNVKDDAEPPKPDDKSDKGDNNPQDIATIVKQAVAEQVKPLQEKLSLYESKELGKNRLGRLESILKEAPETFKNTTLKNFGRMSFENDDNFEEYLKDTEKDLGEFKQQLSNQGLSRFARPVQATSGKAEDVPADVKAYLDSKSPEGSTNLGGKEV